jgi:hypothetical protein
MLYCPTAWPKIPITLPARSWKFSTMLQREVAMFKKRLKTYERALR